ncbi:hypothetical protein [Legionella parisiensis]|uniref:Uncharacterized protein n=1 Tax=Legionella parisiensis TaxID=45071 RepID=A0A1E5JTT0_9GAMM|nr:hypothetical protein [Legionella parisiensis]OEH47954.1 hypothetical protein lpari_01142 [Legionella parisiensis]STX76767.1 Uncharacterised protein [Legionella parisiensis]
MKFFWAGDILNVGLNNQASLNVQGVLKRGYLTIDVEFWRKELL